MFTHFWQETSAFGSRQGQRPRHSRATLNVEALEDRRTPSTTNHALPFQFDGSKPPRITVTPYGQPGDDIVIIGHVGENAAPEPADQTQTDEDNESFYADINAQTSDPAPLFWGEHELNGLIFGYPTVEHAPIAVEIGWKKPDMDEQANFGVYLSPGMLRDVSDMIKVTNPPFPATHHSVNEDIKVTVTARDGFLGLYGKIYVALDGLPRGLHFTATASPDEAKVNVGFLKSKHHSPFVVIQPVGPNASFPYLHGLLNPGASVSFTLHFHHAGGKTLNFHPHVFSGGFVLADQPESELEQL